jgi:hypothetical protein
MTMLRWVVAGLLLAGLVAIIEHLTDTILGEWFRFGGTLSLGDAEPETPRTAAVLPILDSPLTVRDPIEDSADVVKDIVTEGLGVPKLTPWREVFDDVRRQNPHLAEKQVISVAVARSRMAKK